MGSSSDRSVVAVPGRRAPSRPLTYYDAGGPLKSTANRRESTTRQHVRAGAGRQLAGIDRHGQHRVVTDASGQLDEAPVPEALAERLHGRIVHAVLSKQAPGEVDDLRIVGGNAARVPVADRGD